MKIPSTAREWGAGRSGKTVPPGMTYQTLRRKGISVGDLLSQLLSDYTNRVKNKPNDFDFLPNIGMTLISTQGKESVKCSCNNCGNISTVLKGTLRRWESSGKKFCSVCRKASGKVKDIEYYDSELNNPDYRVVDLESGNRLVLEHIHCGKTFSRARGYITSGLEDASIQCPYCYTGPYFVHNKGNYLSKTEEVLTEHLLSFYTYRVEREVPYSSIMDTDRNFRLDIWLPDLGIGLELTSRSNNLPNYNNNLKEKLLLAEKHNIPIHKITSKKDIEDIVRPLLKDKEKRITNAS